MQGDIKDQAYNAAQDAAFTWVLRLLGGRNRFDLSVEIDGLIGSVLSQMKMLLSRCRMAAPH